MATIVAYSNMSTESLPKFIGVLCRTVNIEDYCSSSWKVSDNNKYLADKWKNVPSLNWYFVDYENSTRDSPGSFGVVHDVSDFAGTSLKIRYRFVTRGHILHSYGLVGSYDSLKFALPA